jgi:uncharacterized protein YggE
MRAILFILILAVVAAILAFVTGFLDISQSREAKAPDLSVSGSGVSARGGQTPSFDIETGSVAVGTKPANVQVPTVRVNPPDATEQHNQANSTDGG